MRELLTIGFQEYKDHARWVNLVLVTLCVAGMTSNMLLRRSKAPRRSRRIGFWLYLILCNIAYGLSLSIAHGFPYTNAVGVMSLLLVGLLVSIVWHPDGDDQVPPNDQSLGTWFLHRLDTEVRAIKARRSPGKE